MDRLTITQRIIIIRTCYKNGDSATATYRALRGNYGLHNCTTTQAIGKILKKFEETGVVANIDRFDRSAEHIANVSESVVEDPNVSIPCRCQQLGRSYGTLWRSLHLDLHLHQYKVQLTRQLKPVDNSQRRRYMK